MKAKEYSVLQMAVEQGVRLGWNHAHKHVEKPDAEAIQNCIVDDVTSSIYEWFNFDQQEYESVE
jgi:hypothetical protein